jgi:hypothetical protein
VIVSLLSYDLESIKRRQEEVREVGRAKYGGGVSAGSEFREDV